MCIICGRKSLKLAIDVIDASADFLRDHKRVIVVPMAHFMISLMWFILWLFAFACVVSLNTVTVPAGGSVIPQMRDIIWKEEYKWLAVFMVFGLLWILAFVDYQGKFIVITTTCTYYFNNSPNIKED